MRSSECYQQTDYFGDNPMIIKGWNPKPFFFLFLLQIVIRKNVKWYNLMLHVCSHGSQNNYDFSSRSVCCSKKLAWATPTPRTRLRASWYKQTRTRAPCASNPDTHSTEHAGDRCAFKKSALPPPPPPLHLPPFRSHVHDIASRKQSRSWEWAKARWGCEYEASLY